MTKKKKEEAKVGKETRLKQLCNDLLKEQTRRKLASEALLDHKSVCLRLQEIKQILLAGYSKTNFDKYEALDAEYKKSVERLAKVADADKGKVNMTTIENDIVQEAVKLTRS